MQENTAGKSCRKFLEKQENPAGKKNSAGKSCNAADAQSCGQANLF